MGFKLNKTEKWGLRFLLLFVAGWIALLVYIQFMGDNLVSLRQNDIKRILNTEIFGSKGSLKLPEHVDKVRIEQVDSISADGFLHYSFSFRIRSNEKGKSWHTGAIAEKDLYYKGLTYTLTEK